MVSKRYNTAMYAGHTWNLGGGDIALTRAQRNFLEELVEFPSGINTGKSQLGDNHYESRWTTTQFRRLAPFIALNTKLIEELPRTARGGWGYRLRGGTP